MSENMETHEPQWIGASWYPEVWPEEEWSKDAARMREVGFNMVRVFEFAWHRFEPEEGAFDFEWARRVMDTCHKEGIRVMVGTPTAAPPAWLTSNYPEVLQVRADGQPRRHGQRRHYSVHSRKYRELCARIVGKMVEALHDHPALHSWQIDNEINGTSQGEEAHSEFRKWLRKKYGTIEALNNAWRLEFWSQAYNRFDQVFLPPGGVGGNALQDHFHPSLHYASALFYSDKWEEFIRLQCEIIRRRSDKPVTSNMTTGMGIHWYRHNRQFDRVGFSIYTGVNHPGNMIERLDRMRAEKPVPYWILETAPNWAGGHVQFNIHPAAGSLYAFNWVSTFAGGSMMLYWQWREHPAGQEMLHGTCVTATGRWRPNRDVWEKTARELKEQEKWLAQHPAPQARLGIFRSNESAWALSIEPGARDMDYKTRWRGFYEEFLRRNIWRDVLGADADLSGYRVLVLPLMPVIPRDLRERLTAWVADGGTLILGPATGYRDEEMTVFPNREWGGLEELIGASVYPSRFPVDGGVPGVVVDHGHGRTDTPSGCCDGFQPEGAEAIAHYTGGFGDGAAAVIRNHAGSGTVTTFGYLPDGEAWFRIVSGLLEEAGVSPVATGGDGTVFVAPRGDIDNPAGYGLVNMTGERASVTLAKSGKDRLSGAAMGPTVELGPWQAVLLECP